MKTNGSVQQRQNHNSINAKSTVDYTIPGLTLHDMVKRLASMKNEVRCYPEHCVLYIY